METSRPTDNIDMLYDLLEEYRKICRTKDELIHTQTRVIQSLTNHRTKELINEKT